MLIVCLVLASGLCADAWAQTTAEKPLIVSIGELLARKDDYNGRLVTVRGRMFLGFEANIMYANDADRLAGNPEFALWIDVPNEWDRVRLSRYSGRYGTITGRFLTKKCNGHMCLFGGEISVDKWAQLSPQK